MSEWVIQPVNSDQWPAALQLFYRRATPEERARQVSATSALLNLGELDPRGLLGCYLDGRLAGVMLYTPQPGAFGLVWPPEADCVEAEAALATAALKQLRNRGIKLAQALFSNDEEKRAASLCSNGFTRLTKLLHLRHAVAAFDRRSTEPITLRFRSFQPDLESRFAATLLRTYEGSHDCPELDDLRTVEEVLAGHRAQGRYQPTTWWLAEDDLDTAGILLVNAHLDEPSWELVYMGIVPEARGRGFGRQLTAKALREAHVAGVRFVDLSVDCRNQFAESVYRELGFEPVGAHVVYLARLS